MKFNQINISVSGIPDQLTSRSLDLAKLIDINLRLVISVNIASVSSNYSIENPNYLHRTCIGKINRNYQVTREVTDQGVQLVISVVPH